LVFENDRVRVFETSLAPGEGDQPRERGDHATFVIDGGRVETVMIDDDGHDHSLTTEDRQTTSGHWAATRGRTRLVNIGTTPYRELAVELK
jgi:hypothetical protein